MKKPYFDCWQRQMIIHDTYGGALLKNKLEILKVFRTIGKELHLHEIICWINKNLCYTKSS